MSLLFAKNSYHRDVLQVIELFYFALLCVVFLLAYGVAVQSLLYPRAEDNWWDILYRIFKQPYLSMFGDFETHLDELDGMQLYCCRLHIVVLWRFY